MDEGLKNISKLTELLENSKYAVVITGPGLDEETESLAGDDSASDRLWKMVSPDEFTIHRYQDEYGPFYEEGAPFFSLLYKAKPNATHFVLADLEKRGLVKTVITQNIDGLHQMAGSVNVLELRGTIRSATCEQCEYQAKVEDLLDGAEIGSLPLRCPDCGQPMKPDVVLHGEPPPPDYYKAKQEMLKADLVIMVGADMHNSSDQELISEHKKLVVINDRPTHFDQDAEIVINEQPAKVMKLVREKLSGRR